MKKPIYSRYFCLFILALIHAGVASAHTALPPRQIQLLAKVPARVGSNARTLLLPLTFAIATDSTGRVFKGDSKGRIDLRQAEGGLNILLDSKYIRVRRNGIQYFKKISASQVSRGGEVIFNETDAPLGVLACRAYMDQARSAVIASLPLEQIPSWFESPVSCEVDFNEGCDSDWDGAQILLHSGDKTCAVPSFVPDLIYHGYGHGVFQFLSAKGRLPDQGVAEAYADIIAVLISGDPHFGAGLWKDRPITWSRDLSQPQTLQKESKGGYTSPLALSSAWWEIRQLLVQMLGQSQGSKMTLRALLYSARILHDRAEVPALSSAAVAAAEAFREDREGSTVPGMGCMIQRILAAHGLVAEPEECTQVSLGFQNTTSPGAPPSGQLVIRNLRDQATPTLEVATEPIRLNIQSIAPGQTLVVPIPVGFLKDRSIPSPTCALRFLEGWIHLFTTEGEFLAKTLARIPLPPDARPEG